ncbi:MAG: PaaI family thioesterase [Oscillospiraceae bacterium]|nr:PaaI family thioesterase [Oscillospiraceae bacterium]
MNEKQLHMEEHIKAFIADINENQSDCIVGMLKPSFVECNAAESTLTMSYPAMAWERNPLGVMQGGVVATILDFSIACLSTYYGSGSAVTVSLQTSYLRGCPINGTMMVKVRATKTGKSMIHCFAECWEAKTPDKLVATSVGVYYV